MKSTKINATYSDSVLKIDAPKMEVKKAIPAKQVPVS